MKSLFLAAAVCALAGCASNGRDQTVRSASYLLAEKQAVALDRSLTLHYDNFSDSRCPKDAKCIWAGKTAHRFTLASSQGSESFELDNPRDAFASTRLAGVRIVLERTDVPALAPAAHAVVLSVTVN